MVKRETCLFCVACGGINGCFYHCPEMNQVEVFRDSIRWVGAKVSMQLTGSISYIVIEGKIEI